MDVIVPSYACLWYFECYIIDDYDDSGDGTMMMVSSCDLVLKKEMQT